LKFESIAAAADGGSASGSIVDAQKMLDALDRRLHFIAAELRPSSLDLGIVAAVEQFVQEWASTYGIAAECHSNGVTSHALRPEVDTQIYRIVQEALNNIAKHAHARHVTVLLERRQDGLVVIVEDDGRGFDYEETRSQERGLGLVGMRE